MIKQDFIASKPEDVGIDSELLEDVFERARKEVDSFPPNSAQVAVARHGRIAGLRTFGVAEHGDGEGPATDESLYCIFSCTKVVVASAVWLLLFEEGLLRLDERVADIIPEFATNGKEVVTVEQLLLHACGFPLAPYHPDDWLDRDKRLEAFAYWRLTSEPGSRFEYHATAAHWVLIEIIERRTGVNYQRFIRERITAPMGLDELFLGLPPEQNDRVARVRYVVEPVEPPGGYGEVTPEAVMRFANPKVWPAGVPGGGGMAGAGELALFYQTLIHGGEAPNGKRVIKPETIEFATTVRTTERHRDKMFDIPVNRGLSVVVAGDDGNAFMRGFGRVASGRTIGHGGAGGQISWGDPETGISLGFVTNGFTDWVTLGRRVTALSSLAAKCAVEAPV